VILVGCASPAQPKAMIGQKITEARATHDPVVVTVTGGEKTNPMWTSQISSEDFLTALIVSLRKSALFKSVEASGDAAYRLDATLEDLDQPIAGFNMTVALRVDWKLTRLSDNHVLWHDKILSTYTAKVGDAFAGIKRLRLANEGAARNNIEDALAKLAALDSAKLQQQQASLPE
jgi:hypothetical protein